MYATSRIVANIVIFSLVLCTVVNAQPPRRRKLGLRGSTRDDKVDDNLPVSPSGNEGVDDGDYYYYDTMDNSTVLKSSEQSVEPLSQPQDGSDGDHYDPVDNSTLEEIQSSPSFASGAERLVEYSFDARSEAPEKNENDLDGDYYYNFTTEALQTSPTYALGAERLSRSSEYSLEARVEPPDESEDGADGDYYFDTMDNSTVDEIRSGHAFATGAKTPYKFFEYSSEAPFGAAEENADDSDFDYYDPTENSTTEGVPSGLFPSLGSRWGCWPVCRR